MKSECKNCKLYNTCLEAPMEDCTDYRETAEARRNRIEAEVKAHDERIRADEREKTIDECKEVLRQHWLNGTVAYRIISEINGSLEQLKEGNK